MESYSPITTNSKTYCFFPQKKQGTFQLPVGQHSSGKNNIIELQIFFLKFLDFSADLKFVQNKINGIQEMDIVLSDNITHLTSG